MESVSTMEKLKALKIVNFIAMSDGGVYYSNSKKECNFVMNMLKKHRDLIEYVAEALQEITACSIMERKDYNTDGCHREPQLRLSSQAHPYFTKVRNRLYIDGYKGLSSHYLKLLDAEALAILYMCDGGLYIDKPNPKKKLKNNSYNVNLYLKRLSEGDTLMLKKVIKSKFDLEFNIQGGNGKYYYLRLRCKDVIKFMDLIRPYIFDSFNYKLIPND